MAPTPAPFSIDTLDTIRLDIGDCQRCKLAPTRTNIVFGSGNPHAELVFVGEAPGFDEDQQGLPFVGRAGQLLTKIIESINFKREDVYICNVLKCRPPDNRNPEPDEVASCNPFHASPARSHSPESCLLPWDICRSDRASNGGADFQAARKIFRHGWHACHCNLSPGIPLEISR